MSDIAMTDRDDPFGALFDGAPNQGGYAAFGDQAFSKFYADHFDALTWMVMATHRVDLHRGRDIAQEAMIVALDKWREINEPGAFVRTVAHRRAMDHLRRFHPHSRGEMSFGWLPEMAAPPDE